MLNWHIGAMIAVMVWAVAGCSLLGGGKSGSEAVVNTPPAWFFSPPTDDGRFWYGAAEAVTPKQAEEKALAMIASRLQTTIRSRSQQQLSVSTLNGREQLQRQSSQSVTAESAALTFNNYRVMQRLQQGGRHLVLLQVEQGPFLRQKEQRLQELQQDIELSLAQFKRQSALRQLKQMAPLYAKIDELELLQQLLNAFHRLSEPIDIASQRRALQQAAAGLTFSIQGASGWRSISDVLREGLNRERYTLVTPPSRGQSGVNITIEVSEQRSKVYGNFIVKLFVSLVAQDGLGEAVASRNLELSGASALSYAAATQSAVSSLQQQIAQQSVLTLLGI
ncbi:hypothetical protein D5085_18230 [Ectothiorhodospiraceae bacterium BW-2]|nr:hypothetical protein D5085_18230 [Ectothiorhodospiraceae bacterium BW-2]